MKSDEQGKARAKGWALDGCLFSFLTWLMAGFVVVGLYMGDCFPDHGNACPTDRERNMRLLFVAIGAIAVNAAGLFLVARNHFRASKRD